MEPACPQDGPEASSDASRFRREGAPAPWSKSNRKRGAAEGANQWNA
jgi:hypothetical protein